MFQYAVGRYLSLKTNDKLKFDVRLCKINPLGDYSLALEAFEIEIERNLATTTEIKSLERYKLLAGPQYLSPYYKLHNLLFANPTKYIIEQKFNEMGSTFEKCVLQSPSKNHYLEGWWQNPRYFQSIREILLKDFKLREDISAYAQKVRKKISESNSIAIHVRRLDYVNNPKTKRTHGELKQEYYDSAFKYLNLSNTKNNVAFIFSDDIDWVKENMNFPIETCYVKPNLQKPHEDIYLMSCCDQHIIANSSFSWWGAWLSDKPHRVIAPAHWVTDKRDKNDRIDKDWITIPDWVR